MGLKVSSVLHIRQYNNYFEIRFHLKKVPDLIWATPRKYLVVVLRLKVDLDLFHVPEKQQPPLYYIYRQKQSL